MNCTALNRTVQKEVETQYGKQNTDNRLICLLIADATGFTDKILSSGSLELEQEWSDCLAVLQEYNFIW